MQLRQLLSRVASLLPMTVDHFSSVDDLLLCLANKKTACVIASLSAVVEQGPSVLRALLANRSGVPIVFTAAGPSTSQVVDLVRHGAFSVLDEPLGEELLHKTIVDAIGQSEMSTRDRQLVADYHRRLDRLTSGEREVLESLYAGKLNKQIARELRVSVRTVEQRRQRIFRKMEVPSAVPLACHIATARTLERVFTDTPFN